MRHRKSGRKLKRTASHRKALLASLTTSLLRHKRITTTLAKAKETQPVVEKLISSARGGFKLHEFRRALAVVTNRDVCYKLFHEIGPQFAGRPGGYTRIFKLAKVRQGDASQMAVISLLKADEKVAAEPMRPAVVPAGT